MKQRKWLRRVAKALVLALVLSLTLCVTAHAGTAHGKLLLYKADGSHVTAADNVMISFGGYTERYAFGEEIPGLSILTPVKVTVPGHLNSVSTAPRKLTVDNGLPFNVTDNSFTFIWCPVGLHSVDFTIDFSKTSGSDDPGTVDPVDPGKTDPADPGKTDPADPGKTDPADPGKTDPADPGKTDPTDPGKTDPSDPGKTDPADPGKTDPTDPGKTDPTDPGKTDPADPSNPDNPADPANPDDPADPSKPSTGDTMLIALWAVVLMGTAVGITALVRSKKRA